MVPRVIQLSYHTKLTTLVTIILAPYMTHTHLFCVIDDFFQKLESIYWKSLAQQDKRLRFRSSQLSVSKIIFISIWCNYSQFNNFKAFFTSLTQYKTKQFKTLPCYQRMIYLLNEQVPFMTCLYLLSEDLQSYLALEYQYLVFGMRSAQVRELNKKQLNIS